MPNNENQRYICTSFAGSRLQTKSLIARIGGGAATLNPVWAFLFMSNIKILRINDDRNPEQGLEVYLNHENRIWLNVGQLDDIENMHYLSGYITLDKEDAISLKNKLEELIADM